MAHELSTRTNGFVEMAYTGEKPWHALGQQVEKDASLEEWTQAGMDWRIQRSKVHYATSADAADTLIDESHHVLLRSDSKEALAIVSPMFKVVQPAETLEFFRWRT